MAVLTATAEGGVNGAGVTTGAGEASASQWNAINNGGAAYSNATAAYGSLSIKMPVTTRPTLQWNCGALEKYGRFYVYLPSTLNSWANASFVIINGGGSCTINIADTGAVSVGFNSSPFSVKGTVLIARDKWVRIEYHAIPGNSATGTVEARLFNSTHSLTPDDSIVGAARDVGNTWSTITNGFQNVNIAGGDIFIDQIVGEATTWVGPVPVCTSVPLIHGTFSVGSVVTCDGGIWNNGLSLGYYQGIQYHTLTYQWKRDGVNIAGETNRTYTLLSADLVHYLQCQVTAAGVAVTSETATVLSAGVLI